MPCAIARRFKGGTAPIRRNAVRPARRSGAGPVKTRTRPSVIQTPAQIGVIAGALVALDGVGGAEVAPAAPRVGERRDQRLDVADAHVEALGVDRVDAVRGVADEGEAGRGVAARVLDAEREDGARGGEAERVAERVADDRAQFVEEVGLGQVAQAPGLGRVLDPGDAAAVVADREEGERTLGPQPLVALRVMGRRVPDGEA